MTHRNRRRRSDMKKSMMLTLSAMTMFIAMSNARAAMPIDARKTAYFVGKAASQLPPGYITEDFLGSWRFPPGATLHSG